MSTWLKCAISLVVIFGILYVLISPLPEVDATFSGKSALTFFILVIHAYLFFFAFSSNLRLSGPGFASFADLLNKNCVRLC